MKKIYALFMMLCLVLSATAMPLEGVVKRAVQNGEDVIVLTHEEDSTAHIYRVVNGEAVAEVSLEGVLPVDTENPGSYLAISDIAVTEDGKLVANNYNRCSFGDGVVESGYKRGTLTFYIWNDLAAAPAIWFQSKASSNSNNSDQGYTMALTGTSDNANILVSGVHNTQRGVRMSHFSVVDGVFEDTQDGAAHLPYYYYIGSNFKGASAGADAAVFNEQTQGVNIQFLASPLAEENWIIDGELVDPIEFTNPQTHGGEVVKGQTLSTDLGKKFNGATIVKVEDQVLMVAPYATEYGVLAGAKVLDITNGLDAAEEVTIAYLDSDIEATAAATAVKVVEGGLVVTLVADATIYTLNVEVKFEPAYMEIEEEVTDLVIDLDYMTLSGTGNNFGTEIYLTLGQDNADGTFTLDPENSFVTINGWDANFIEGYAYDIDINANTAKALTKVELNGEYFAITFNMSSTPVEALDIVITDAVVTVDTIPMFGDMVEYALNMTANWTNPADGVTYPVLVEIPVYYPESTEPSEIMSTVTVGGMGDTDPWLGFGEGYLTVTTANDVVTATGLVENAWAGFAANITISGKLPQDPGPGTGLDNVQVEVKTVKMIKNGQLIISKDGKEYNAQGATVK